MINLLSNDSKITRQMRLIFIGIAVLLAIFYDIFFWGKETGLSFPLFILIYLASFITVCIIYKQVRQKWALWFLIPILILSFDVMLYKNGLVHFVVPIAVVILVILFSVLLTLRNPEKHPIKFVGIPIFRNIILLSPFFSYVWRDLFHWEKLSSVIWIKIIKGILIALPLLIIFGLLFYEADQLFNLIIKNLFDLDLYGDAYRTAIWRIIRTIILTFLVAGFFYYLLSNKHVLDYKEEKLRKFDQDITLIVLSLVNAIFLFFVVIQIKYLFGDQSFITEYGLTYAEYARRGFFELVWVIILVVLMMLIIFRSFAKYGTSKAVAALQSLLIAQTFVIAISALKRMWLYQEAYGYTVLRLYVEWFIYFLLILLIISLVSIWVKWSFRKYLYLSMVLGVIAFTFVSSLNVHRMIAKKNIDRYLQTQNRLDTSYLEYFLSMDILPELTRLKNIEDKDIQEFLKSKIYEEKERIDQLGNWQEFHFSAWRAKSVIDYFGPDYYKGLSINEVAAALKIKTGPVKQSEQNEVKEEKSEQNENSVSRQEEAPNKESLIEREIREGKITVVEDCQLPPDFNLTPVSNIQGMTKKTVCTLTNIKLLSGDLAKTLVVVDEIRTIDRDEIKLWWIRYFAQIEGEWSFLYATEIRPTSITKVYLEESGKILEEWKNSLEQMFYYRGSLEVYRSGYHIKLEMVKVPSN
jgi:hypothetical protein